MAQPLRQERTVTETATVTPITPVTVAPDSAALRAHQILRFGFTAAPIIAGVDKFFHLLTNWDQYLAPIVPRVLGINGHSFMLAAGVVEVVAGIGVALMPRIFGFVVSGWLMGIVVNLLLTGQYYDIALRDFGLSLGALALGLLSGYSDRRRLFLRR